VRLPNIKYKDFNMNTSILQSPTGKRPTHRIFAVTRTNDSDKGYWAPIGAAWTNRDGKGFNLKLEYLPLLGADIIIREIDEEAERAYRERRAAGLAAITPDQDIDGDRYAEFAN
jgi:hypothetical protein